MDPILPPSPGLPPDPPPMDSEGNPPDGDPAGAALRVAFELLAACISNSILMAPIWCGKQSPQAEHFSFGILRKILLNILFSSVKPGHEMKILEEFCIQAKDMAEQWQLLAGEPKGNA